MSEDVATNVLVASHESLLLQASDYWLRRLGYAVTLCNDGTQVEEIAQAIRPEVFLLHSALPGCDGFALCRWMKTNALLRNSYAILLIAPDERQILEAFEAGADDYLPIPLSELDLALRVRVGARFASTLHHLEMTSIETILRNAESRRDAEDMEARTLTLVEMAAAMQSEMCRQSEQEEERVRAAQSATILQAAIALQHEINNPLFAITGSAENAVKHLKRYGGGVDPDAMQTRLERILAGAERIERTLQAFATLVTPTLKEYVPGVSMLELNGSVAETERKSA